MLPANETNSSKNSPSQSLHYSHPKLTDEQKHRLFSQAARAVARDRQTMADAAMKAKLSGAIRTALSPRFVPDEIVQVAEVPRTLSGKKQELPIKKLLLGQPLEKVVNPDAMANPGCLAWYVEFAKQRGK